MLSIPVTFFQAPADTDATIVEPDRACATLPAGRAFATDLVTKPAGMAWVAQLPHASFVPCIDVLVYAQIALVAHVPTARAPALATVMIMSRSGQYAL